MHEFRPRFWIGNSWEQKPMRAVFLAGLAVETVPEPEPGTITIFDRHGYPIIRTENPTEITLNDTQSDLTV